MTNLEIGLSVTTIIFFFLYIREKMKPKTAEEIQYQREKDEIEKNINNRNMKNLKTWMNK